MEVSCFEKFEIGLILSSWRRFENVLILRITPSKGLIRFLPVDCLLWPYKHLGIQKCLKMLTAYYGKTYKGQMVWQIWNPIETKQLAKVWKFSDSLLGGEEVEIWQFFANHSLPYVKKKVWHVAFTFSNNIWGISIEKMGNLLIFLAFTPNRPT